LINFESVVASHPTSQPYELIGRLIAREHESVHETLILQDAKHAVEGGEVASGDYGQLDHGDLDLGSYDAENVEGLLLINNELRGGRARG
jgi:hypothetical protein